MTTPIDYISARCGEMFTSTWSEAAATAEFNRDFPTSKRYALVCDRCYVLIRRFLKSRKQLAWSNIASLAENMLSDH